MKKSTKKRRIPVNKSPTGLFFCIAYGATMSPQRCQATRDPSKIKTSPGIDMVCRNACKGCAQKKSVDNGTIPLIPMPKSLDDLAAYQQKA